MLPNEYTEGASQQKQIRTDSASVPNKPGNGVGGRAGTHENHHGGVPLASPVNPDNPGEGNAGVDFTNADFPMAFGSGV